MKKNKKKSKIEAVLDGNVDILEAKLLSNEDIEGLSIFDKVGLKCAVTDFAILLGAYVSDEYHVDDDSSLRGRTGWWYLSSSYGDGDVRVVHKDGDRLWTSAGKRSGAVRPALPFSNISDISPNGVRGRSGFLEVEYGEYPQYAVDASLGRTLESEFSAGRLRKTGKTYTTDLRNWNARSKKFSPVEHEEFEYNGKRYVRVKSNCYESGYKLSNGVKVMPNDIVWLEVSPITWYVDESSRMLVSKTLLASGIRFRNDGQYKGDFKTTEMYMFLNDYFLKDIKVERSQDYSISSDIKNIISKIKEICEKLPDELKSKILAKLIEYRYDYQKEIDEEKRKRNVPVSFDQKKDIHLTLNNVDPSVNYSTKLNKLLNSLYMEKSLIKNISDIEGYKELLNKNITSEPVNDGSIGYLISSMVYLSREFPHSVKIEIINKISLLLTKSIDKANNLMNNLFSDRIILTLDNKERDFTKILREDLYNLLEKTRLYDNITSEYRLLYDALNNKNDTSGYKKVDSLLDMLDQTKYCILLLQVIDVKDKLLLKYNHLCDKYFVLFNDKLNNFNVTKEELGGLKLSLINDLQNLIKEINEESKVDYNNVILLNSDDYLEQVLAESLSNLMLGEWSQKVEIPLGYVDVKVIREFIKELYTNINCSELNTSQKEQLIGELKEYIKLWITDIKNKEDIKKLMKMITNKLANMTYVLGDIVDSKTK